LTLHAFVQQEEIRNFTRETRIGSQNKSYGRSPKETECQSICDDIKGRRSFELMVGQTTQSRLNSGIKVKICDTMLLYSKER